MIFLQKNTSVAKDSDELNETSTEGVFIIVSRPGSLTSLATSIVESLSKKNLGVLLNFRTNFKLLDKSIKEKCSDSSSIYLIDCVSRQSGAKLKSAGSCYFVESPQALTEISIALTTALNSGKFKFLVFDSLTAFLMYHKTEVCEKFMHYLASKARNHDLNGFILSVDEEKSAKVISVISQFCDKVITI